MSEEFKEAFKQGRRGNILPLIINELIDDFLEDLKEFELKRYSDMIRTLKNIREKWEAKKNE